MKIEGNSTNWAGILEMKMMRIHSKNSRWPYPPKPHQGGRQALGMGCHIKVTVKSPTTRHTLTIVLWCVKKVVWKHMGKSGYGQANYRNIQNFNQPPVHAARQQDAEYSAVNLVGSSIDVCHCQSAAIHFWWKFFATKWNKSVGPIPCLLFCLKTVFVIFGTMIGGSGR